MNFTGSLQTSSFTIFKARKDSYDYLIRLFPKYCELQLSDLYAYAFM